MEIHVTRQLRKSMTPWERKVWVVLCNRGLEDSKFRRQFKIGNFVVDFCCLEMRLVVELDGGQHNDPKAQARDVKRQKQIENYGYRVLRFWNNEVDTNFEGVIDRVRDHLVV